MPSSQRSATQDARGHGPCTACSLAIIPSTLSAHPLVINPCLPAFHPNYSNTHSRFARNHIIAGPYLLLLSPAPGLGRGCLMTVRSLKEQSLGAGTPFSGDKAVTSQGTTRRPRLLLAALIALPASSCVLLLNFLCHVGFGQVAVILEEFWNLRDLPSCLDTPL